MDVYRRAFLRGLAATGFVGLSAATAGARADVEAGSVSVKDFGAKGDGATNDRAAVVSALRASKSIVFPEGDYYLGELGRSIPSTAISLRGGRIRIRSQGRVRLIVNTIEKAVTTVFGVSSVSDLFVGDFEIVDHGGDARQKWRGAVGFMIVGQTGPSSGISFGRVTARNLVAGILVRGRTANRVSGIRVDRLVCEDCYYGVNCQENGDDMVIGSIETTNCNRSYFVYGVTGHRVSVRSMNGAQASADCLIKRYEFDTSDIVLRYFARGTRIKAPHGLVVFEQQPGPGTGAGVIRDVSVDLDVDAEASTGYPVLFRSYTHDGKPDVNQTRNVWDRIRVSGFARTAAQAVMHAEMLPAKRGRLTVRGGLLTDRSVSDAFEVDAVDG